MAQEAERQRTERQNRALHLFFTHVSDALNDAGMDMRKTLKPGVEIPWNARTIKEFVWRPIQQAVTGKESTTDLTTDELDKVLTVVDRVLAQKGIDVEFPNIETFVERMRGRL